MSHKLGITLVLVAISFSTIAQTFDWARTMGGTDVDRGSSITVDVMGNVYSTGTFKGTVDFDPGSNAYNLTSAGLEDVFITKFDSFGNFIWAKNMGGSLSDASSSLVLDNSGNIYVTGSYSVTADFDPNSAIFNLISQGGPDIFVCKLDASGNLIWAKSMGGVSTDMGRCINIDGSGNLYITGSFSGSADLDPGPGINGFTSYGNSNLADIFICKLDSSGNFVWAKRMGGGSSDFAIRTTLDAAGNIYSTGYFLGTADFDPSSATFNLTASDALGDVFVSKLDPSGNFIWAKRMGGTSADKAYSIAMDSNGNVYLCGVFRETSDFDPGTSTFNLTASGSNADIFICKLDSFGNFSWAKKVGNSGSDQAFSIIVDGVDNIYYTGSFQGTVDFDPGSGTFNLSTSITMSDIFLSKLDENGNFIWAKKMGGSSSEIGNVIHIDQVGNVFVIGNFSGTCDFDPSTATNNLTSSGQEDVFVVKFAPCINTSHTINETICDSYTSPSGLFTWTNSGTYTDVMPNSIGCDSVITVNLTINNSSTASLNETACDSYTWGLNGATYTTSGAYTHEGTNGSGCPLTTTLNLTINNSSTTSVNQTACDSYTWALDGTTYTTSGTYTHLGTNGSGCPLTTTLNLTINNVNVGVANNSPILVANQSGANYQWINCSDNSQIIGANSDSFTATENGSYAVIISMNGCTDTSTCEIIQNVGFEDHEKVNFQIYPNPFSTSTTLLFEEAQTNTQLTIIDVSGKILDNFIFSGKEMIIDSKNLSSGKYFVHIKTQEGYTLTKKIQVQ